MRVRDQNFLHRGSLEARNLPRGLHHCMLRVVTVFGYWTYWHRRELETMPLALGARQWINKV